MKKYQITFITKEENHDSVKKTVESFGGKIVKEEYIGKRKFAYPIKKEAAGYYVNLVFDIDYTKLPQLEKKLRLDEDLLRYLLVNKEVIKKTIEKKKKEVESKKKPESLEEKPSQLDLAEEPKKKELKETIKKTPISVKEPKSDLREIKEKLDTKSLSQEKTPPKEKITKVPGKPKEESVSEEERLKKLEEKLDELLKE